MNHSHCSTTLGLWFYVSCLLLFSHICSNTFRLFLLLGCLIDGRVKIMLLFLVTFKRKKGNVKMGNVGTRPRAPCQLSFSIREHNTTQIFITTFTYFSLQHDLRSACFLFRRILCFIFSNCINRARISVYVYRSFAGIADIYKPSSYF